MEANLDNMSEPCGMLELITSFVDVDHDGGCLTCHSHSAGVLIFVNRARIIWFSKQQATVVTFTFESDSIAIQQAFDHIEAQPNKL
jgi:hypothetical protein